MAPNEIEVRTKWTEKINWMTLEKHLKKDPSNVFYRVFFVKQIEASYCCVMVL